VKIAVFGRKFDKSFESGLHTFFDDICKYQAEYYIYEPFYEFLKNTSALSLCVPGTFKSFNEISSDFDFFFSLGGDGTFLEAVSYVRKSGVPIIGINTGRLGFLANIAQEEISDSLKNLFTGNYVIEERNLIAFKMRDNPFEFPYALNEVTIQKRDTSLITVDVEIDGAFLNSYWTDGLIISTPTGSTAYSMSAGGPIVAPDCRVLIISPIASHNLTVRPIVVNDVYEIKLKVHSRSGQFLATLDSKSCALGPDTEISLKIADFPTRIVRLPNHTFYNTIRKKLMWGADIRN
jgi:NAD+ kinase